MISLQLRLLSALMLSVCVMGCRAGVAPPSNSGARAVVSDYFDALAQQDWDTAYAQLHPDTCQRLNRALFETRARAYLKQLGFPLGRTRIRSCDEQAERAIARVTLSDSDGSMKHNFHEGLLLRPTNTGWRIVLPERFGLSN